MSEKEYIAFHIYWGRWEKRDTLDEALKAMPKSGISSMDYDWDDFQSRQYGGRNRVIVYEAPKGSEVSHNMFGPTIKTKETISFSGTYLIIINIF